MVGKGSANIASAAADVLKASTLQARAFRKTLHEHDKFLLEAVNTNLGTLYALFQEDHVRKTLSKNGIAPYLGEADSRIRSEIRAVQHNLKLNPDQAVEYMRSMVEPMGPGPGERTDGGE